ncbi:MAG: hypothetical protein ACOCPM_04170 [Bacteroidales bacterium]
MIQRMIFAILVFLLSMQMVAQPSEPDMPLDSPEQVRMLKNLNYSVQQQQSNVKDLSARLQNLQHQNDSLQNEVAVYKNAINDSLSNYKAALKDELEVQQSDVNEGFFELRKRFFLVAGFVLLLALLLLVVYLVLYKKYKSGYAALAERFSKLEEAYDHLSKQVVENDQKQQNELDKKLREYDRKINKDVDRKLENNNELLAKDVRIVHGPALKMAQEIQNLQNKIQPETDRHEARQIKREASSMERELKHQGYRINDYTDKKVKEGMPLNVQNMKESEAIGKKIDITLSPELKFNKKIIQKATVRVEEEKEEDSNSESKD